MEILIWFILATAIVFQITCMSLVFGKAEKPGWGVIVPIYGIVLLCDTAEKPRWWALLCVVPFVNIFAFIVLSIGVARHFDRSDAFGVGLALVPVVFWAILAFGDAEYDTYDSTEQTVPVRKATPASPPTRPAARPQRGTAPAVVRRSMPVSAPPVEVTRPQREALPSFAERAVLARAAPVPVTPLKEEVAPASSEIAAPASQVVHRQREALAVEERPAPASAVPVEVSHPRREASPVLVEGSAPLPAAPVPVARLTPEAAPAGDSVTERPQIARCPSCRKIHVEVVEEAGVRRCGSCLSVLPSYIQVAG